MTIAIDIEESTLSPSITSHQVYHDGIEAPFIPASMIVSNLQYEVNFKEKPTPGQKWDFFKKSPIVQRSLLSNVAFVATPGRVLAIMGPSGSGKTTLLDLIANRQARNVGKLHGEILLNGFPINQFGSVRKRLVGYVTQESDFMEALTVLETLMFAAKMRLPRSMSNQEKADRVRIVMQELNLTHIKDTKIGGAAIRGISGGEKRRVTIGIELLSSPSVLLLDEPTSGLSSTDALNVAKVIKDLSSKGRTVILTVHQPRSDIYELFDDLLLLSLGKVAYFGRAQLAAAYFDGLGYKCPVGWNIADYLLDLITLHQNNLSKEGSPAALEDLANMYSNYLSTNPEGSLTQLLREHKNISEKIGGEVLLSKLKKEYTTEYATTVLNQTLLISQRSLTNLARHPIIFQAAAVVQIVFAVIIGSLFSSLRDRPELGGMSFNKSVSLFIISSFLGTMTFAAMPQFILERSIFSRERAAGMYRASSYFMAKTIVETLSHTVLTIIFMGITYYLIGLHGSLVYYFILLAVFVNVSLSVIAAIGAVAETAEVGLTLLAGISTMNMVFTGFLVSRADIPRGWIWAFWTSYYQWAFSGMLINEFSDGSREGNATLAYFGTGQVEWLTKWRVVLILIGYFILFRVIGLALLLSKKH
ncbi:hypothetical protein MVEG_07009 [Podila verticillata NRRL 6337]|nr:hypothetical protein MVEG_07009 [Podila verticillata NRRL 6337]